MDAGTGAITMRSDLTYPYRVHINSLTDHLVRPGALSWIWPVFAASSVGNLILNQSARRTLSNDMRRQSEKVETRGLVKKSQAYIPGKLVTSQEREI
jgi:hypothetical protein